MRRRGELKLIQQAILQGWNITAKGRHDAIALLNEVLSDPHATPRERLRACKLAVTMNEADLLLDGDVALLEQVRALGSEMQHRDH